MTRATWRERIVAARERGQFTTQDVDDARTSWQTCAVGEQHAAMPFVVLYGERWSGLSGCGPVDDTLWRLGGTESGFGRAVQDHQFDAAEELLDQIEDRVLQLKREVVP